MDIKEFATMLDGREYNYQQFTKKEIQIAKDNGFVIVYGASDDLMEFDGAIYAEAGCFDGGKVYFNETGAVLDEEFENSKCIEAFWCDEEKEAVWSYETDIPHEKFMIFEDGEPYCEAIVFNIKDLKENKDNKESMTEQEAIKVLRSNLHLDCKITEAIEELKAREVAVKALEKQVPKKVIFNNNGEELLCPCCGIDFMGAIQDADHDPYYCFECGQSLEWPNHE